MMTRFLAVRLGLWLLVPGLAVLSAASVAAQTGLPAIDANGAKLVTWVTGIARDEAGRPVAGAKVYARATFHGGLRMYEEIRTAVSDEHGRYSVEGGSDRAMFSATLVAHVPGRLPAISWFTLPPSQDSDPLTGERRHREHKPASIDLVFPSRAGRLEVLVMNDGRPLPDANVALRLEGTDPFNNWGLGGETPARQELIAICRPVAKTDGDGIAWFEALTPGVYSIFAVYGNQRAAADMADLYGRFQLDPSVNKGEARRVAVHVGETMSHQLAVDRHHLVELEFDVQRNGQPWRDQESLSMGGFLPNGAAATLALSVGPKPANTFRFEASGLAEVNFCSAGPSRFPRTYPFVSANSVVAVSPRLSREFPISIVAQENRGGAIRVRLEDEAGQPLAGTACFEGRRAGSVRCTSGNREIELQGTLIEGIEPAPGFVTATAIDRLQILPNHTLGRIPSSDELTGHFELMPVPVITNNNDEIDVTLRAELVGYVGGRLKPAPGTSPDDYRLSVGEHDQRRGIGVYYHAQSGEFVAGPYRSGTASLLAYTRYGRRPLRATTLKVMAGQVTEASLEITESEVAVNLREDRLMDTRIVQADGVTPARMAHLATFIPADGKLSPVGLTDTGGVVRPHWSFDPDELRPLPEGTPTEPVAIAWAPGQCGAAIVPLRIDTAEPLTIQLPKPVSVNGLVMVAGDRDSTARLITVRAQHAGRGVLDDLLSVETTAGADGLFHLAGLTPGHYRIQAALDGIWLSGSEAITLGDVQIPPLKLTIAEPGGPVLVRVTGQQTRRLTRLVIDRPAGPMADRLWPESLTPDGAGVIRIPALESGLHVVRVGQVERVIEVPPLSASKGQPVEIEISVDQ